MFKEYEGCKFTVQRSNSSVSLQFLVTQIKKGVKWLIAKYINYLHLANLDNINVHLFFLSCCNTIAPKIILIFFSIKGIDFSFNSQVQIFWWQSISQTTITETRSEDSKINTILVRNRGPDISFWSLDNEMYRIGRA